MARPVRQPGGHPDHVASVAAQTAPCRRARQPGPARRCHGEHHLRVVVLRRADRASGAVRAWRMVGRDAVTSLVIVGLLVKEGREAWEREDDED